MKTSLVACFLCLAGASASADTVILKNGGRLVGTTTVIGDRVSVRLETGTVKIPLSSVEKIEPSVSPVDEYTARVVLLKRDDVKGHLALADWCSINGLSSCERIELEAVISADPNHLEARERLGYEKVGDRWMRGEDLLLARGKVKSEGRWVSQSEADDLAAARDRAYAARREAEATARAEQATRATAARERAAETRVFVGRRAPQRVRRHWCVRYACGRRGYGGSSSGYSNGRSCGAAPAAPAPRGCSGTPGVQRRPVIVSRNPSKGAD